MREVQKRQLQFGQVPVKVWLDPKSRDDIPAVLKGLQHLYKEKQEELFMLLEKHILPGTHRGVGRPGMEMWRILVLGVLKQGLGCDFDACTISRTITRRCGRCWATATSPTRRITSFRQLSTTCR